MDAICNRMNLNGRLSLCLMVSCYINEAVIPSPRGFARVGQPGLVKWKSCVVDGLDWLPLLLSGKNEGKLMVKISDEP